MPPATEICCDPLRYDGFGSISCFSLQGLQGWKARRCCSALEPLGDDGSCLPSPFWWSKHPRLNLFFQFRPAQTFSSLSLWSWQEPRNLTTRMWRNVFRSRGLQTRSTSPNASSFTSASCQGSGISLNVLKVTYKITAFARGVLHSWLA